MRLLPGGLERVFFSDSGSVAVEVAMKMAVQYWLNRRRGRRSSSPSRAAITATPSATMAVCDPEEGMHSLFAGLLPEQLIADLPRDEATAAASTRCSNATPASSPASWSSRWCKARAA